MTVEELIEQLKLLHPKSIVLAVKQDGICTYPGTPTCFKTVNKVTYCTKDGRDYLYPNRDCKQYDENICVKISANYPYGQTK